MAPNSLTNPLRREHANVSRGTGPISIEFRKLRRLAGFLIAPGAQADSFFDDMVGVVTDPVGVRRASDTLANSAERTVNEIQEIENKTNKDLSDRIEQVRTVLEPVIAAADRNAQNLREIVAGAIIKMRALEEKATKDAIDLVYREECVSEVATQDQVERGLSKIIGEIISSRPGVKIFGIRVINFSLNEVEITQPDQAYRSTKKALLDRIAAIKDQDDASEILSAYQNIARFAGFTKCYYLGLGLDEQYADEQLKYEKLSSPWLHVVGPRL